MLKPFAAETRVSPAAVPARVFSVPERGDAGAFDRWANGSGALSKADPDTLARAVRAHKAGDAFAQAALTVALMVAIGAVAVVLSTGRASAAGLLVAHVSDHAAALAGVALVGGALLLAARSALRRAKVRVPRRPR